MVEHQSQEQVKIWQSQSWVVKSRSNSKIKAGQDSKSSKGGGRMSSIKGQRWSKFKARSKSKSSKPKASQIWAKSKLDGQKRWSFTRLEARMKRTCDGRCGGSMGRLRLIGSRVTPLSLLFLGAAAWPCSRFLAVAAGFGWGLSPSCLFFFLLVGLGGWGASGACWGIGAGRASGRSAWVLFEQFLEGWGWDAVQRPKRGVTHWGYN
jgi:hypothetical protein